jgi:anthranilate phosphoribosyltransferase
VLEQLIRQLDTARDLEVGQVDAGVAALLDEATPVAAKAAFLTALSRKGETAEEIAAFARALRNKSIQPPLDAETRKREILDVCGTGGDRLNTFNISTTVSIIAAAAGVTVAKHGNRAITSQAGSADVLEALGIRIELSPEQAARFLRDHHFAFLFAPNYHPAFKFLAATRKLCAEKGQRTIFNILGPLLNPAHPSAQLIGVPRPNLCEPMAQVLKALGVRRGMVVSGLVPLDETDANGQTKTVPRHLDELSTLGENTIAEFYQDKGFHSSVMSPEEFPIQKAALTDLCGADAVTNANIVRKLLLGADRGPKRDAVLLNAAAALFVSGRCKTFVDGWELAGDLIDSGKARGKLEELVAASQKL